MTFTTALHTFGTVRPTSNRVGEVQRMCTEDEGDDEEKGLGCPEVSATIERELEGCQAQEERGNKEGRERKMQAT